MGNRLEGKVAIVTGAGRGIGRGEALALASEGAKVVVNDYGGDQFGRGSAATPADEVVAEIKGNGGQAVANYDSVATAAGGENIIRTAINSFGKLDILVNNAGIDVARMIFNMSPEEWDIVLKVHLYGTFYTTQPACVLFRQQRSGRIINTSSGVAVNVRGNYGQSNYGAAKGGILGFTRKVAWDMGKYGVTCNAILPAAGTRLNVGNPEVTRTRTEEALARSAQNKPEDVAPIVVWLASDAAANVNGRAFSAKTGEVGIYAEMQVENKLVKDTAWTIDELFDLMPKTLAAGLVNAQPPQVPR
ncbi:MAG: SDR family oxidoreductase [Chloroflexi bacterium]|nr:SDR family oxidoreductase [Chloroflexota bacterium]